MRAPERNGVFRFALCGLLAVGLLVPGLPAAAQTVTLVASTWLPGPDASGPATYAGTVDQPAGQSMSQLSGWVVDTTAQGWSGIDDVQVLNGLMQAGGTLVAHPTFQLNRPDVAASLNNPFWAPSGFAASLPANPFAATAALYVYVHTPAKGWWYLQVTSSTALAPLAAAPTLNIETPTPLATVHSNVPFTMRGFAFDPAAGPGQGTGVDRVQVYLGGDRGTGTYIGDATLGSFDKFAATTSSQVANAGWLLTFQPNSWLGNLSDNQRTDLTVYAHSTVTGSDAQAQTSIIISVP